MLVLVRIHLVLRTHNRASSTTGPANTEWAMAKTSKSMASRPSNDNKQWSDADDRLLLDLINRHVPKEQIALVIGRTQRAVAQRIWDRHQDAWEASGHPEVSPRAKPAGGPAETLPEALARIEAKQDQALAMMRLLLQALGEDRPEGEREEARPNGRAHP